MNIKKIHDRKMHLEEVEQFTGEEGEKHVLQVCVLSVVVLPDLWYTRKLVMLVVVSRLSHPWKFVTSDIIVDTSSKSHFHNTSIILSML